MTDLLIILALIVLNGVFAMAELAIASSKRLRLQDMAGKGSAGARVAIELGDNPSGFLSTVQIGITLISIFNGAFGEAALVEKLAPQLSDYAATREARPSMHAEAREVIQWTRGQLSATQVAFLLPFPQWRPMPGKWRSAW